MAHFAILDDDDNVINVIVSREDIIASGAAGDPNKIIQTSRNTVGGKHLFGEVPLRKNYACIGGKYDRQRDAFIPPKIFNSWILNEETCLWEAPIPMPVKDGFAYYWDEENLKWKEELIPPEESA